MRGLRCRVCAQVMDVCSVGVGVECDDQRRCGGRGLWRTVLVKCRGDDGGHWREIANDVLIPHHTHTHTHTHTHAHTHAITYHLTHHPDKSRPGTPVRPHHPPASGARPHQTRELALAHHQPAEHVGESQCLTHSVSVRRGQHPRANVGDVMIRLHMRAICSCGSGCTCGCRGNGRGCGGEGIGGGGGGGGSWL
jgi:hypothetical protein